VIRNKQLFRFYEGLSGKVRFKASRIPAACGVLIAGALIVYFGGYGNAAMTIAPIYLLGLAIGPFLPETAGKPLPG
jgi:hypothetical protein